MNDETEVLRETVKRVEVLTEDISNITNNICVNATKALDSLHPLAQRARGGGSGASSHRQLIAKIEALLPYINAVQQATPVINDGVLAAGPQLYGQVWAELDVTLEELTSSENKSFYGVVNEIEKLKNTAEDSLLEATRSDAKRVFDFPGPAEAEDVASLSELLNLSASRNLTKQTNVIAVTHIRQQATQATASQQVETAAALKKFRNFKQQYMQQQQDLLLHLFPEAQALEYMSLIEEIFKAEEAQLNKKVTRLSQGKSKGAMSALDDLDASLQYDPEGAHEFLPKAAEQLRASYASADESVRNQKIDTDVGIAGATDRVALLVRDISKRSNAVNAALEQKGLRSYLPAPPPEWLKDFPLKVQMPNLADLYSADLLENLLYYIVLQNKKLGRSPSQQGISLTINTSFLRHFIEKNEMVDKQSLTMKRIEKYHKQGVKMYLTEWQVLSQHLMDPTQTKAGSKLSSKDREAIKERFRQFNSGFETLVEKHRKTQISDKELKQELVSSIKSTIKPLYQRFYDQHRGGDFTKNLDKYLKYDMKRLDEILSTL